MKATEIIARDMLFLIKDSNSSSDFSEIDSDSSDSESDDENSLWDLYMMLILLQRYLSITINLLNELRDYESHFNLWY